MDKKLYIIKGTGLALDGQVVTVLEWQGDYAVVSPPNSKSDVQNTMIKKPCLQEVKADKTFMYQFTIKKINEDPSWPEMQERALQVHKCVRDVDLDTILEYLETNLTPILRMEK